jgi:small-conductance mechanosensitive channel
MEIITDLKNQILTYYDGIIAIIPKIFIAIVLTTIFLTVMGWIRRNLTKYLTGRADDTLLPHFISDIFKIVNIFLATIVFLYVIGQIAVASSILGAAGVSAFVIGFAFRDLGENFLTGIIMAFDRLFRVGDTVKSQEVEGSIIQMNLRETHIKTFDGKDVYVPNGQILKNPLYNYTIDGYMRRSFTIGLDYDSNIEQARKLILQALSDTTGVLTNSKKPFCMVSAFAASTVTMTVQFWIDTFDDTHSSLEVHSQAMNNVLQILTDHTFNMPGDVIELKNYKDQPLQSLNN